MSLVLNERVYAEAEARLGRKLTVAEKRLDIVGMDRDLAQAKRRLHKAIEKEKSRVIAALVDRQHARMQVTDEMERALLWLYERSRRHALRELAQLDVPERRSFAERPSLPLRLRFVIDRLRGLLGGIQIRVEQEITDALVADIGTVSRQSLIRELEQQIAGSLNAASRLVSPTFAAGRSYVWEEHQDLVDGWERTAVLDGGTCEICAARDGLAFSTLDAAFESLPDFGPDPECLGSDRCRCTLLPQAAAVAA